MELIEQIGKLLDDHGEDMIIITHDGKEYEFTLIQCFTIEQGYSPFDEDYYQMACKGLDQFLDEDELEDWVHHLQEAIKTGRW